MKRPTSRAGRAAALLAALAVAGWLSAGDSSSSAARAAAAAPAAPLALAMAVAPPTIDGVLDDPAWAAGLKYEGFKTFNPDYGKDGSQRTEAYATYDAENFYFAFRCYDTEPSKIKAALSKRDGIFQDDIVFVVLDTFDSAQSGYGFVLNPLGIQGDGMLDVNGNMDQSFDAVWYSQGRIDAQGWTVEARVPMESIRFPGRGVQTWRVLFIRYLTRTSEQVSFPAIDPNYGSVLGQAQRFQVSGLHSQRVLEFIPAATTRVAYERRGPEMGRTERTPLSQVPSLTGKFGLTSDLTFDGTYNPDFSQVEADAGQVDFNQRSALYYEEKRPFFLEGNDMWKFSGNVENGPLQSVVYTRTIVDPAFGFKLTGKISRRDSIAAIYAHDSLPDDPVDVHPDFTIARFKHALKDDAYLGAFYTGREAGSSYNRVAGLDGRFRLSQTQVASFHAFGSLTKTPEAATASPDHALGLDYSFNNREWGVDLGYQDISKDFRVDSGFVTRTGLRRFSAFIIYNIFPKSKFFQKIEPFYWSYHLYDTIYHMWETTNLFTLRFKLPRTTMVRFDTLLANEVYAGSRFTRSGFGFQAQSQVAKSLWVQLFARRWGSIFYDPEAPYQGYGTTAMSGLAYQPLTQLELDLDLTYVDFYRRLDRSKVYEYLILRSRNTFQINKYLFVRGIVEYNDFYKRMTLDGLVSFTYIPGTVVHLGYGSAFEKQEWDPALEGFAPSSRFHEMQRGFFFKVSYLYRF